MAVSCRLVVPLPFTRSATMAREASQSPMLVVIMVQGYYIRLGVYILEGRWLGVRGVG